MGDTKIVDIREMLAETEPVKTYFIDSSRMLTVNGPHRRYLPLWSRPLVNSAFRGTRRDYQIRYQMPNEGYL